MSFGNLETRNLGVILMSVEPTQIPLETSPEVATPIRANESNGGTSEEVAAEEVMADELMGDDGADESESGDAPVSAFEMAGDMSSEEMSAENMSAEPNEMGFGNSENAQGHPNANAKPLKNLHDDDEEENDNLDEIENILELGEEQFPRFTLAKNKARFLRMVSWYRGKEEWIEVAPVSGVTKLFKQQTKELEGIRSSKLDYEMELETGTLTPSQRSYRRDELKMCRVQEKMAVHLISKLQVKIKSGRR